MVSAAAMLAFLIGGSGIAALATDIGTKKLGAANDVKMSLQGAKGDAEPMNAQVVQQGDTIAIQIVQGGNVEPKPVAISSGSCPMPGAPVRKLPPFKGNQYQAFVHHAKLGDYQDGKHALVVYGPHGKTIYACGTLDRPNALIH